AETFGETVADVVGTILGAAPRIAGTVMTAGAPAGALAAGRLARFGPRVARLGEVLTRETIGGAAFGGLHGAAEAIRGAPAEQVAGTVGREAALGFAGGLAGEALGAGIRALSRTRRAGRVVGEVPQLPEGTRPEQPPLLPAGETAQPQLLGAGPRIAGQIEAPQVAGLLPEVTPSGRQELLDQALGRYEEDLRRFYQERPDLLQE